MAEEKDIITQFCEDIINGPTGLHTFENREMAVPKIDRDVATACWVIRCLANPHNPKSREVLNSIQRRRLEVLQITEGQ